MTKKFTKRLLTSLVVREMQIKTVRCNFYTREIGENHQDRDCQC